MVKFQWVWLVAGLIAPSSSNAAGLGSKALGKKTIRTFSSSSQPQEVQAFLYIPTTKSALPISIDLRRQEDYDRFINGLLRSRIKDNIAETKPKTKWSAAKKNNRGKGEKPKERSKATKLTKEKQVLRKLFDSIEKDSATTSQSVDDNGTQQEDPSHESTYEVVKVVRKSGQDKLAKLRKQGKKHHRN